MIYFLLLFIVVRQNSYSVCNLTKCHKTETNFSSFTEQDLESCWWTPHQRLFTSQDGRHGGRAGGGAWHRHGLPVSVTIAPCWPAEAPWSAAGALLSALKSKPSTVLAVGAVCLCECVCVCACVTACVCVCHQATSSGSLRICPNLHTWPPLFAGHKSLW